MKDISLTLWGTEDKPLPLELWVHESLMSAVIKDVEATSSSAPVGPVIMSCSFSVKGDFKASSSLR